MFQTIRKTELPISRMMGDEVALWEVVLNPFHMEWFYVCRTMTIGDDTTRDMLHISNIRTLKHLIDTQDETNKITDVYLVSPHWMNGTPHWEMERLLEARESSHQTGHGFIYVLHDGRVYPAQNENLLSSSDSLFNEGDFLK